MNQPQTIEEATAIIYGTSTLPRKESDMNEQENTNSTNGKPNFVSNVRWQSARGFEYITTIRADNIEEMFTLGEIFETEVEAAGGNPLVGSSLRNPNEKLPSANDPATREVPVKIEGVPVVDGQTGKAVTVALEDGLHLFHVKEVFRDAGLNGGESKFKVVIEEQDYGYSKGKWGITMLKHSHPEKFYPNWKTWEAGKRKAPAVGAEMVIIKDPGEGQNLAEAVEFRAE